MDDTVGSRIKTLREARRLSQTDLAKLIGISPQSISAYETDTREPSNDVLVRLAQLYRVSTDYLLGVEKKITVSTNGLEPDDVAMLRKIVQYMYEKNSK